jgi:TM2 domain-containing membrane protein YozV
MSLTTDQRILIETQVSARRKNALLAYFLWFFVGLISAHRFYFGRPGTAILQILSYFIVIGFIWWVVDAFLIPGMIRRDEDKIRAELYAQVTGGDRSGRQRRPRNSAHNVVPDDDEDRYRDRYEDDQRRRSTRRPGNGPWDDRQEPRL